MEETPTIGVSAITKSLLFRLYRSNNLTATGRHSVESLLRTGGTGAASCSGPAEKSGTAETSAVLYATAIDACANASTALLLLRRAQKQHLADQAVFVAALKQLAQETRYAEVYDITHEMLFLEGLEMDKYTLSLLLRVSLSAITEKQHEDAAVSAISRYVAHCIQRHPQLLNRAVWNQLKDLLSLGHGELFSELLTTAVVTQPVVIGAQITAATATSVFSALQVQQQQQQQEQQQHASSTEDTRARATAETALALLKALCWAQQQLTIVAVPSGAVTKPVSLHTSHFNVVLRMLMTAQLFDAAEDVYHLMRGGQHECPPSHNAQSSETPLPPVTQSQAVVSPFAHVSTQQEEAAEGSAQPVAVTTTTTTWQPSTFTIAELVRCGRQSGDTGLLVGALAWAMDELVYIPEAVISDVLSYLYR